LLILAGGQWENKPLIDDRRVFDEMFDSSRGINPNYGLLWWTNTGGRWAYAPEGTVAALGAFNRFLFIVRGHQLVVVRIGDRAEEGFGNEFGRLLSLAFGD
jgi:hypothetical protein